MLKYFAYGSNMDPRQMRDRLNCDVRRREAARLPGYRLVFNKKSFSRPGSGAANVIPCARSIVEGVLYEISEDALHQLDRYEGSPWHYERKRVAVAKSCGSVVKEVYLYVAQNPTLLAEGLRPTSEYLALLLAAGSESDKQAKLLSAAYLAELANTPVLGPLHGV
jgi:gamma-glutamylcyclotransferase (GGCT)/AIG2-like uncharacterized protein YtfP